MPDEPAVLDKPVSHLDAAKDVFAQAAKKTPVAPDPAKKEPEPKTTPIKNVADILKQGVKAPEPVKKVETPSAPEPDEFDRLELPQDASKAAKDNFKKLKAARLEDRTRAQEHEKALQDLRTSTETQTKELETLRQQSKDSEVYIKERDELKERLKSFDLANDPEFKAEFEGPMAKQRGVIDKILKSNEVDSDQFFALSPDQRRGKINEMIEAGLDPLSQSEMVKAYLDFEELEGNRAQALSDAGGRLEELQRKQREQGRSMLDRNKEVFSEVYNRMEGDSAFMATVEISDDLSAEEQASLEEFNKGVLEIKPEAERIAFGDASEEDLAAAAIGASTLKFLLKTGIPKLMREHEGLLVALAEAREEVKELRGRNPNYVPGSKPDAVKGEKQLRELGHKAAAKRLNLGKPG